MRFDYVIIGSGSAGGMVAYRLSAEPGVNVLLLEAGGREGHWTTRMPAATRNNFLGGPRNWCFTGEPEPHMNDRRIFQPRGKVIGGSSSLNGMVFVRGHRRDFDAWRDAGATGWGYDDVLPHFRSMESYLGEPSPYRGTDGPIAVDRVRDHHPLESAFLDAVEMAGHGAAQDYNGASQQGATPFDANIANGERCGTAAIIRGIRSRPNLKIITDAMATRLETRAGRVCAVEFLHKGALRRASCDREIILSCGAAQSPQLLMLSGIGPAARLREHAIKVVHDLPGVGENLQDHLEVHVKHSCKRGASLNRLLRPHRKLAIGLQWFLARSGPAAKPPSRVGAFVRSGDSAEWPDIQYHFWPYFIEGWSPPPNKDGYCFDVGPVQTRSRGWVRLAGPDPLAAPRIRLNGLAHEEDRRVFREAIRITRDIAAQRAFDALRGPEVSPGPQVQSDSDIDAYVRQNATTAFHLCGSCAIGTSDMAVVSPDLRVRGLDGLRVVDASVMPSITNGNLNAPSLMIGERGASMILGESNRPDNAGPKGPNG